jgi:ubiquitin C-terminal hydrolase
MGFIGMAGWAHEVTEDEHARGIRQEEQDAAEFLRLFLDQIHAPQIRMTTTLNGLASVPEDVRLVTLNMPTNIRVQRLQQLIDALFVPERTDLGVKVRNQPNDPEYLPIHLMRFYTVGFQARAGQSPPPGQAAVPFAILKNQATVQVPQRFRPFGGAEYELRAFAEHTGNAVATGHYIAYVKSRDTWHYVNDSQVRCHANIQDAVQRAYLLFYKRL